MKKAILGVQVSSGQREMSLNHDVTGLTPHTTLQSKNQR